MQHIGVTGRSPLLRPPRRSMRGLLFSTRRIVFARPLYLVGERLDIWHSKPLLPINRIIALARFVLMEKTNRSNRAEFLQKCLNTEFMDLIRCHL